MSTEARPQEDSIQLTIAGTQVPFSDLMDRRIDNSSFIAEAQESFSTASPFPHLVFDGLFNPALLKDVWREFDQVHWQDWRRYDRPEERKRGTDRGVRLGPAAQLYFSQIHSPQFITFLQNVTKIDGLIAEVSLNNGGLHEIPEGGAMRLHYDFNRDSHTKLRTALVFITYLNEGWDEDFGGCLELCDPDGVAQTQSILPEFGRSILVAHGPRSLHGHPEPVRTPDHRTRRSIAAYFYTAVDSESTESAPYRSTLFTSPMKTATLQRAKNIVRYLLPPIVVDAIRWMKSCGR